MHVIEEKVCLIIPCYNEEKRLKLDKFLDCFGSSRFLFVNDGSTDRTLDLIQRHLNERIFLLDLGKNAGKAEAVRLGMLHAARNPPFNEAEWMGFWDADLATPLSEITGFLNYANLYGDRVEAVFGSRIYKLGSSIRRSYLRHLLGRIFATFAAILLGIKSYDSQCGAKLFKKPVINSAFSEPFLSKWIFDIEILMRLKNRTVIEYPLRSWSDISGSKLNMIANTTTVLHDLIRIRRKYGKIRDSNGSLNRE